MDMSFLDAASDPKNKGVLPASAFCMSMKILRVS